MNILNISAYKFVELTQLDELKRRLVGLAEDCAIKGTILLSVEGINLMLAGEQGKMREFLHAFTQDNRFADIVFKESFSTDIPFQRLLVRIKPEIITLKMPTINPARKTVVHLAPETFKAWLDAGRDLIVLDTRNAFEISYGTFVNAIDLNINKFTEFPAAARQALAAYKDKPIVMFCTGGVRCEKAGPALTEQGFTQVYQLDGGILNYFAKCGSAHYQGDCFVFDERIALDADLVSTH